jgi:predicted metal-dependent phosphoesterase TrpH
MTLLRNHHKGYRPPLASMSVDFHTHTFASKDCLTSPENLVQAAHCRGLNRIVVTDHNTISGALGAHVLDPELIIIGEEIMTSRGEILAAFVTVEIQPGLSPQETIRQLRDQGAFISVSHPFDMWRSGAWQLTDLMEIAPLVDAIEIFNARCMTPAANQKAFEFASQQGLPGTAGSDAHAAFEVGAATLHLPTFTDPDTLRIAIRDGKVRGHLSPFWVHFISRYAHLCKKVV